VENLNQAHWDAVPASIPVVALAFVYHNVVPVITASLEGDLRRVRTALVVGTSLPSEPRPSLLHSDAHK
jgi:tyrosine-specific transport protein